MHQEPFTSRASDGPSLQHVQRWLSAHSRLFALSSAVILLVTASVTVAAQSAGSNSPLGTTQHDNMQHGRLQHGGLLGQAAEFDQQFIDMMVPHHQGAIEIK